MRVSVLSDLLAQRIVRGGGAQPIYRQLHRLLQQAILTRELPAGARVPSSRHLAAAPGIRRNTRRHAFAPVALQGVASEATGRGTVVAECGTAGVGGDAAAFPVRAPRPG
ncbi:GntR family transcriptional regulator, partial [Burkholderia sp. 4812]|nr:GntR family transcriptional regulator [Burkholderia sp. 4812]